MKLPLRTLNFPLGRRGIVAFLATKNKPYTNDNVLTHCSM